ncbi:NAD-dependent epimerase/dehydratase family protein [Rhodobacterales bacterium HKCCE4037]|nr:NAD-dependent epimerase/dehydratase family protein [Rhodobacterales bacterium HKCCE4037]
MRLLIFGYGFSSRAIAQALPDSWEVRATTRSKEKFGAIRADGVEPLLFPGADLRPHVEWASHVLLSAGPQDGHDPVLGELHDAFATADHLQWVGYLSTTGVYGDHGGGWVTEETPADSETKRGKARIAAEGEWLALHEAHGLPVHIFRLAGIYGPGRGPFEKVRNGTARRVIKEGQVFSRIHVEDIAQTVIASINRPNPGAAYNVCDDDPAPPQDVLAYAAELLGVPVPPAVPFEEAEMSPMARSFYSDSKRVDNSRIKDELGVVLRYPDYRSGLAQLLSAENES